ncbi:MAG: hypothetical protein CMN94_02615 [Synechococcus sp. EAC657]|nr:hypothetical protein [Synechococcus sp. EAC657]
MVESSIDGHCELAWQLMNVAEQPHQVFTIDCQAFTISLPGQAQSLLAASRVGFDIVNKVNLP